MTLEELKIVISAETEKIRSDMEEVKKQLGGLEKETSKATSGIKALFKKLLVGVVALKIGQKIGQAITSGIREAMNVEAAIQQIKRIMGESTNQFLKWANTQAIAFNMSKAQALKYGSVFGNLVSGFSKTTQEAMTNTTDLLKASSIIASATGRSMQDVMERIRSGLLGNTEAIEDLGVNVNIAMIQSTEAFKKFANGRSWNQIDFQTQQQIRLMAILEQTHRKYGDTVAQNTSSQLQQLVAILGNVRLSLGQAFLPIVQIILPVLIKFAQGLSYVMNIIAQFSQALFGKSVGQKQVQSTNAQTKAMTNFGNATEKAGKQARKAQSFLAGFDEINALPSAAAANDSEGASGGGAGGAIPMPELDTGNWIDAPSEVSKAVQDMVDRVKVRFSEMTTFISSNKDIIISSLAGLAAGFASYQIISNWGTIMGAVSKAITSVGNALSGISIPILAISALIALLVGNIVYLWKTNEDFRDSVKEVWNQIKTFVTTVVNDMWTIVKGIWDKYGQDLMNNLAGFMKSIQNLILTVWGIIKPIITNALEMLNWLWEKHLKGLVQQVGEFIAKLVNGALEIWNKFISPIVNWLIQVLEPGFAGAFKVVINIVGSAVASIADITKGIFKALGGVIDFITGVFTGNWRKAWQGIKDIFSGVFGSLAGIVKYPLNLIIDAVNNVIRGLNRIDIDIPDWDWIPDKYQGKKFGINIPTIPKLAQGGYVGANSPMLAMIGDNPRYGEIVAPENKLYEQAFKAMMDALSLNGNGNEGETTIIIQNVIDGEVVTEKVIKNINRKGRNGNGTVIVV